MQVFINNLYRPQSAEDKIGEEVTKSLKRMLETMRAEVERSSSNISTATATTKNLHGTTENYQKLSGTLDESRGLIRDLWKKNRNDMIYIMGALGIFVATVAYVVLQRTPGVVWLPGKLIVNQLSNLIPKTKGIVEKITEITEAALSDTEEFEEPPKMFIDTIEEEEAEPQEEYGSDELLKESAEEAELKETKIVEIKEPEIVTEKKEEASVQVSEEPTNPLTKEEANPADDIKEEEVALSETISDTPKTEETDALNVESYEQLQVTEPEKEMNAEIFEKYDTEESPKTESTDSKIEAKEANDKPLVDIEKAEETVSESTIAASNTDDSFEPTKAQVIEKDANDSTPITETVEHENTLNLTPETIEPQFAPNSVTETITPTEAAEIIAPTMITETAELVPESISKSEIIESDSKTDTIEPTSTIIEGSEKPTVTITPTETDSDAYTTATATTSYYTATDTESDSLKDYSSGTELYRESDQKLEL